MKPSVGAFILAAFSAGLATGLMDSQNSIPLAILSTLVFVFAIVLDYNRV